MPDIPSERRSIWVQIKLEGTGFANNTEFDLRYALENAVINSGVGSPEGAGSGVGWMDFSFGVDNIEAVESALVFVVDLMKKYNVPLEAYRLEVFRQYDTVCDDLPDFQLGDCLSFRFEDDDYGAALVLQRGNKDSGTNPQIGKPPVSNTSDETLVAVLDYKQSNRPTLAIFEQRNWLIGTHESRLGQPFLVWLDCFGGITVEQVGQIALSHNDLRECRFHLSWEDLPGHVIHEKDRGKNPMTVNDIFPIYQTGTGLSYKFADDEYGAALVLKTATDGPNWGETLLGILDYKAPHMPSADIFEKREWLRVTQEWRKGQPFLVWALWSPEDIELQVITDINIQDDDPKICLLNLNWEDIPEFVLREKIGSDS